MGTEAADAFLAMARAVFVILKALVVFWLNWDWQMQLLSIIFVIAFYFMTKADVQKDRAEIDFELLRANGTGRFNAAARANLFTAGCFALVVALLIGVGMAWFMIKYGAGEGSILRGS